MKNTGYQRKDGLTVVKAVVHSNDQIAPGAFILSFKRTFNFIPGQVVGITLAPDDEVRLYSIASGKDEPLIRILYTVLKKGYLTPKLSLLRKGDILFHSMPFGSFTGTVEPAYWIAAGTGIAPFASMYLSGLGNQKQVIHGSRFLHSFYFQELFLKTMEKNYIRCCSSEKGTGVFHGRLTEYVETQTGMPPDYFYYLCGSAEMIIETRSILLSKGIPFGNILAEIYF
jgi:ferredoxin--NADP+ reductase